MSKPTWAINARTGPIRNWQSLKIFACEGLICVIDERPGKNEGQYLVLTPSDLDERVKALMRPYRNQKIPSASDRVARSRHQQWINGANNCRECIKEARHMGDPSDPAVQAWWSRHRRDTTVKVSFSAGADAVGYPTLPAIPRGNKTGKTVTIDGELVGGKVHVPAIHKLPKKKNRSGLIMLD